MVTSMLEKAIEIEGLLRIIRDGNPLPETYILLNIKTAELAEQAVCLEERTGTPEPETTHADFVMAQPAPPAPSMPEVVFTVQTPQSKEETNSTAMEAAAGFMDSDSASTEEDLSLIEEDDIMLSFEDAPEFSNASTPEEDTKPMTSEETVHVFDMAGVPEEEAEEEDTEGAEDNTDVAIQTEYSPEDSWNQQESDPVFTVMAKTTSEAPASEATTETPEDITEEPAADTDFHQQDTLQIDTEKITQPSKRQTKLKSAFSLNDRFLYARELFEGNMKMFDSTLEFIEGIEDYSIIEDYFYSELEWDPEDSNVASFMDILRPHFKE